MGTRLDHLDQLQERRDRPYRDGLQAREIIDPSASEALYDRLAGHYDRAELGSYAVTTIGEHLDRLAATAKLPAGSWLDLGCGTGSLLVSTRRLDRPRVGIDLSLGMAASARASGAAVAVGDARELPIRSGSTALVTAFFDVLNHCLSRSELERLLGEAFRVLDARGTFLFDLSAVDHLRLWDGVVQETPVGDDRLRQQATFDSTRGRLTVEFSLVDSAGARVESFGSLVERAWPLGMVESALRRAGFVDVENRSLRRARGRDLRYLVWGRKP